MKQLLIVAMTTFFVGCLSDPKIESTKQWEGHYFTVDELKQKINDIDLDKDESIWMMSNHTLNRLLKNTRK